MIFLFYFWVHFHVHVYLFKQLLVVVEYDKKCFNFNPPPPSLSHTHKIIMQKSSYPLLRKCGLYGERHRMFGSSLWRSKQNHLSFSFAHVFAKISFKNQKNKTSAVLRVPVFELYHAALYIINLNTQRLEIFWQNISIRILLIVYLIDQIHAAFKDTASC